MIILVWRRHLYYRLEARLLSGSCDVDINGTLQFSGWLTLNRDIAHRPRVHRRVHVAGIHRGPGVDTIRCIGRTRDHVRRITNISRANVGTCRLVGVLWRVLALRGMGVIQIAGHVGDLQKAD